MSFRKCLPFARVVIWRPLEATGIIQANGNGGIDQDRFQIHLEGRAERICQGDR